MRYSKTWLFFALVSLLSHAVSAADSSNVDETRVSHTKATNSVEQRLWGLSDQEWTRYQLLMQGPRGTWSPNLDPVSVLGIYAKTNAERKRYAEWLAKLEHARLGKEIAFQREYDAAFSRLFPEAKVIGAKWDELRFYAPVTAASERWVPRLLARSLNTKVDIYLSGADDAAIRHWAEQYRIPADKVRARRITLNHQPSSIPFDRPTLLAVKDGAIRKLDLDRLEESP